jgi:hypothetical protein
LLFFRLCVIFFPAFFNRYSMCSPSARAISCSERVRLEEEYAAARDRLRNLLRLRVLTRIEQRRLADSVAMAIARLKEHAAAHGCQR